MNFKDKLNLYDFIRGLRAYQGITDLSSDFDWIISTTNKIEKTLYIQELSLENIDDISSELVVLALDNDCDTHTKLAHPAHREEAQKLILKCVEELVARVPTVGVCMSVEDLAPGGLDATDAIELAQKLEKIGVAFIVASCGSERFAPLKNRRLTSQKNSQEKFDAPEFFIASASWLVPHLKIPVLAQGDLSDWKRAKKLCEHFGLKGVVKCI